MQPDFWLTAIPLFLIPILLLALWRIGLRHLKNYQSPLLGKIEVVQKYNGEKMLMINNYIQGISIEKDSVKHSYWFCIADVVAKFCKRKDDPQVLMLGLGANAIPNLISEMNPQIRQTIIEIDKFIIDACRKYFHLDKLPLYQLIQADAYEIFERKENAIPVFDTIIVDIFTGQPPYISLQSNEPSYIEKIIPYLKKDGMIIFNRPAHKEAVRYDGQKLKEYLNTLFKETKIFDIKDPRGFRNYVITATKKLRKVTSS